MTQFRTYDYTSGRFWQVDPKADIAGQESLTPYQYSLNNPIRYNDPFGDCPECPTNEEFAASLSTDILQLKHSLYNVVAYTVGSDKRATFVPSGDGGYETGFVNVSKISGSKSLNAVIDLISVASTLAGANSPALILSQSTGKGSVDDIAHAVVDGAKSTTSKSGKFTQPTLPDKKVVEENGVTIEHFYKSGDHAPAHMHVKGGGSKTKIGSNGKPIKGSSELSGTQKKVVENNKSKIRSTGNKINKYQQYQDRLKDQ